MKGRNLVVVGAFLVVAVVLVYLQWGGSGERETGPVRAADRDAGEPSGTKSPAILASPDQVERDKVSIQLPLEGTGFFALPRGRRYMHSFDSSAETNMSMGDPPQSMDMKTSFAGKLEVVVVAVRADELILRLSLSDVVFLVNGAPPGETESERSAASEPFQGKHLVRMGRDGTTLGYRFANDNGMARNLTRSLWSALHCVIPEGDEKEWAVEDADATGPHVRRYAWLEEALPSVPRKLSITREPLEEEADAPQTFGHGEALVSNELRWPVRVSYEEDAVLQAGDLGLKAYQHALFAFALTEQGSVPLSSLEEIAEEWEWSPVSGRGEEMQAGGGAVSASGRDVTQLTIDGVVQEIIDLLAARSDRIASSMVYMSDHGESLGEKGLYLHGMPYMFAPSEQTHVPFIMWVSQSYSKLFGLTSECLESHTADTTSHDNLFHTVLGLMDVKATHYDPALDVTATCRSPSS